MPDDPTKQEKHVTELAGPDDRWVSVTDASRIARRQEHTIRTWIAQGVLPVNPQRVGINKKTRQVRLSDLVKLTPIIDPDAGIATDWGTLDLPSIPKQQQQLVEQMAVLQQDVTGQLASLAGEQEKFAEETRQAWHIHQQQYQALAHRTDEQQQLIQRVRDSLTESLHDLDRSLHQELADQQEQHQRLMEQVIVYSQELQQAREDLSALVSETEKTLRQALTDQVGQSETALRQALETVRVVSAEATEQVRKNVAGLEERLVSAVEKLREAHEELTATITRLHAHTDQQFSQVGSRLEPLETTLGLLQAEIQERAATAKQEARRLRRDLDAQGRFQQALQKQLDEERKAREELAKQVGQGLAPSPQKGKGHE